MYVHNIIYVFSEHREDDLCEHQKMIVANTCKMLSVNNVSFLLFEVNEYTNGIYKSKWHIQTKRKLHIYTYIYIHIFHGNRNK